MDGNVGGARIDPSSLYSIRQKVGGGIKKKFHCWRGREGERWGGVGGRTQFFFVLHHEQQFNVDVSSLAKQLSTGSYSAWI